MSNVNTRKVLAQFLRSEQLLQEPQAGTATRLSNGLLSSCAGSRAILPDGSMQPQRLREVSQKFIASSCWSILFSGLWKRKRRRWLRGLIVPGFELCAATYMANPSRGGAKSKWTLRGQKPCRVKGLEGVLKEEWYARQGSNLRPFAPEANALSI